MLGNKKKGFTLVELLAVIVILAIILVIAVPQIMKTIDSAREGALISSAKLIAASAEKEYLARKTLGDTEFDKDNFSLECSEIVKQAEDYGYCIIKFNNGKATVMLEGKGKFADKYVCNGTKTTGTVSEESCIPFIKTADELKQKAKTGGSYLLANDLTIEDIDGTFVTIPANVEFDLDLNNHTISGEIISTGENGYLFEVRGTMSVSNGTIETISTENKEWNNRDCVFSVQGGILNIDNATIENKGGSDMAYAIATNNFGETTVNIDSSIIKSTFSGINVFNSGPDMNNLTINNSTIEGGVRGAIWVQNYTLQDFGTEEKMETQQALLNINILNRNNVFTGTNGIAFVYGFNNQEYYDANGNAVDSNGNLITSN